MEKTKDKRRTALEAMVLVFILAIAFIALWVVAEHLKGEREVEPVDSPINVSLKISGDGWVIEYLDVDTLNNSVFKLLLECSKVYDFSVDYTYWEGFDSVFVNSINGTRNGDYGMWWQYYVNGVYGEMGSDRKEIFEGDMIEWRFEEPGQ